MNRFGKYAPTIRRGAVDPAGSAGFLFLSSAKGGGGGLLLLRLEICNLPRQVRRVNVRVAFQAAPLPEGFRPLLG